MYLIDFLSLPKGCLEYDLYLRNFSTSFPRSFLEGAATVEILTFYDTPLDMIEPGAFNSSTFENTTTLLLERGSLVPTISSSAFEGLANVRALLINSPTMDMNETPKNLFSALTSLRTLSIRFISNRKMDLDKVIGEYATVETLDLSENWIEIIPEGVLDRLPNLESFNIFRSQVLSIEPGAFVGLPRLRSVNLGLNSIGSYAVGLLDEIASREGAFIQLYMAFVCDCSLSALEDLKERFFSALAYIECFNDGGNELFEEYREKCAFTATSSDYEATTI